MEVRRMNILTCQSVCNYNSVQTKINTPPPHPHTHKRINYAVLYGKYQISYPEDLAAVAAALLHHFAVAAVPVAVAELQVPSGHPYGKWDKFADAETMIEDSLYEICDCMVVSYSLLSFLHDK